MNTPAQNLRRRCVVLHSKLRFWKRLCAMLGTLLLACAIVIVLAYAKLP